MSDGSDVTTENLKPPLIFKDTLSRFKEFMPDVYLRINEGKYLKEVDAKDKLSGKQLEHFLQIKKVLFISKESNISYSSIKFGLMFMMKTKK